MIKLILEHMWTYTHVDIASTYVLLLPESVFFACACVTYLLHKYFRFDDIDVDLFTLCEKVLKLLETLNTMNLNNSITRYMHNSIYYVQQTLNHIITNMDHMGNADTTTKVYTTGRHRKHRHWPIQAR